MKDRELTGGFGGWWTASCLAVALTGCLSSTAPGSEVATWHGTLGPGVAGGGAPIRRSAVVRVLTHSAPIDFDLSLEGVVSGGANALTSLRVAVRTNPDSAEITASAHAVPGMGGEQHIHLIPQVRTKVGFSDTAWDGTHTFTSTGLFVTGDMTIASASGGRVVVRGEANVMQYDPLAACAGRERLPPSDDAVGQMCLVSATQ